MLDLNRVTIQGDGGLLDRLAELPDPRNRRGVRHRIASILAVASCAVLSGARSFTAIGEFAAELGQDALARLGGRYHPARRCYIAPHEATIRRALHAVDADRLDHVVGGWLAEQVTAGWADVQPAIAVDGKTLRGATDRDGHQLRLLAAVVHHEGVVVAQRGVPKETNEISGFRPLLDDMDLTGVVVTADALHTQTDHARFLVQDKQAAYVFTVKGNQPGLEATINHLAPEAFSPSTHRDRSGPRTDRAAHDPDRQPTRARHLPPRSPVVRDPTPPHRPRRAAPVG